jgi:hypothetical protein
MGWWFWVLALSGPALGVVAAVFSVLSMRAEEEAPTGRHRADPPPAEELPRPTYFYRI